MKLLIKTENPVLQNMYENHEHYNPGDSGLDIFFPDTITIQPGETVCIDLKIQCEAFKTVEMNKNISYYLFPRSSIVKTPLRLSNSVGIIDAGYRGNLMAYVDNIKDIPFTINCGERLFQICSPDLSPITFSLTDILSETSRGSGGFGSTDTPRNNNQVSESTPTV